MDLSSIFRLDNIKNLDIKNIMIIIIPLFFIMMILFRSVKSQFRIILISFLLSLLSSYLGSDKVPEPIAKFIQHKTGVNNISKTNNSNK